MTAPYFPGIEPVTFRTPSTPQGLAFRHYDPDRVVLGKRMEDHLRIAVCYWHSFCWSGSDVFGEGTFQRPWLTAADPLAGARMKADAAFELLEKLGVRYFTFHDRDVAPEGASLAEGKENLTRMVDYLGEAMSRTGKRVLWGTANLFGHPRYAAGAATSPDPAIFACAAFQVRDAMEATHRLGGDGYVLWGGREGYESLLNTDLRRELEQLGRFMALVVEHKHRIGFKGDLFIEPKPMEPTKHQYDFDTAAVLAFLQRFDLEREIKVNIEVNHATLSGHTFHHEVTYALANDIFGSVDANRGDPQLGWDTDQFPNSVEELTPVLHTLLQSGGFSRGGFNFDAKLRRQSTATADLFHAHIGGIDTLALALEKGAGLVQEGTLKRIVTERYAPWNGELGRAILEGKMALADVAARASAAGPGPLPPSGEQERIEGLLQRHLYG